MYGIFRECWVTLRQYFGGYGEPLDNFRAYLYIVLFLAAAIYIAVRERNVARRVLLGFTPLVIIAGFLFPLTKWAYVSKIDPPVGETYYRILWLVPVYVVIAYAVCLLISRAKRYTVKTVVAVATVLVIALSGSLIYTNRYMTKAENMYHIPQYAINICDAIKDANGEGQVVVAFPTELVYFVRQYTTDIKMPYGRDYTDWTDKDYFHPVYDAMEKPEVINAKELVAATRDPEGNGNADVRCKYIVLKEGRKIDADLTTLGLKLVATVDGYKIFEDPEQQ